MDQTRMRQQHFEFHGPCTLNITNNNGYLSEPFTEPVSLKVTLSQKNELIQDAKAAGYSNLSVYMRDMLVLGKSVRPFINRTLKDLIGKNF